jgi:hypothetical protein
MVSKMILERTKVQEAQEAWVKAHGPDIAAALDALAGQDLDAEPFIRSLSKLVEKRAKSMVTADEAHTQELTDDAAPREARDAAAATVANLLRFARTAVATMYGQTALTRAGLAEAITSDPAALVIQARQFLKSAGAKGFQLPEAKHEGLAEINVPALVGKVEAALPALETALANVATEDAEAQGTLRAKQDALAAFEGAFSPVNDVLYALARLAGLRRWARSCRRCRGARARLMRWPTRPRARVARPPGRDELRSVERQAARDRPNMGTASRHVTPARKSCSLD